MALDVLGISKAVESVTPLIDKLFTTDEERATAKLKVLELMSKGDLAQLAVNQQEAAHQSLFVAGWRPFVGWTCAAALVLSFIVIPLMQCVAVYYSYATGEHVPVEGLPDLDWATLGPILMGLLGLGAFRSYEKTKGVARDK